MKKYEKYLLYTIPMMALFILQTILAFWDNDLSKSLIVLLLMIVFPIACFITPLLFSLKHRFTVIIPLFNIIMFLVTCFYMYTDIDAVLTYSCIYLAASIIGSTIGHFINKTSE